MSEPFWILGLRDLLGHLADAKSQPPGTPMADIMIERWEAAVPYMLKPVPDEDLRRAYESTSGEPDDPVADALAAEMDRRELDI